MRYQYGIFLLLFLLASCNTRTRHPVKLEGKTMGTTYHVTYIAEQPGPGGRSPEQIRAAIDSLLAVFNNSVSTYIPTSTISGVNAPDTLIAVDDYFSRVFRKAREVSENTDGAFDVTVMPLVNAWGFGYTDTIRIDSLVIDSLRQLVDYRNVSLDERDGKLYIRKTDKRVQVDFSAIAKGYGVDLLALLLESYGMENYMIEIGGEVRVKGKNEKNEPWSVGIEKPVDDPGGAHQQLFSVLKLTDCALATSGNYRNYYYRDGKKVSHEINPKTGYPALNSLLSVTVVAPDCMTADAYATAFMVMGLEKTLDHLRSDTTLNAYLIYSGNDGELKTAQTARIRSMMEQ